MSKKLTYDAAFAELQSILDNLQSEETGLDKLSDVLKRAKELTNYCKQKLREIEDDLNDMNANGA